MEIYIFLTQILPHFFFRWNRKKVLKIKMLQPWPRWLLLIVLMVLWWFNVGNWYKGMETKKLKIKSISLKKNYARLFWHFQNFLHSFDSRFLNYDYLINDYLLVISSCDWDFLYPLLKTYLSSFQLTFSLACIFACIFDCIFACICDCIFAGCIVLYYAELKSLRVIYWLPVIKAALLN